MEINSNGCFPGWFVKVGFVGREYIFVLSAIVLCQRPAGWVFLMSVMTEMIKNMNHGL